MPAPVDQQKRLSYDDIVRGMEEIAQDPDDKDRFKALKALAATQSAGIVLPEPLDDAATTDRMTRLMKGVGIDVCQRSFYRAFPQSKADIHTAPKLTEDDIPADMMSRVQSVNTLKRLYHTFPEIKRPGYPPGYPRGKGIALQAAWCKRAAAKILLDREQAKANEASSVPTQA